MRQGRVQAVPSLLGMRHWSSLQRFFAHLPANSELEETTHLSLDCL